MKPAFLLRMLFTLLVAATAASAAPDSYNGPTPVPYKSTAHFSKWYDPNITPDRPARPFRPAPLIYPEKWRAWGQPAYAIVEFLVADSGFPKEVQCTEATDRAFAKAAIKAIENSYFDPAFKNQQGVYSKLTLRLSFTVTPPAPAQPAAPAAPAEQAPAAK
jgi:outer membrane biosynthesis protein TonB